MSSAFNLHVGVDYHVINFQVNPRSVRKRGTHGIVLVMTLPEELVAQKQVKQ